MLITSCAKFSQLVVNCCQSESAEKAVDQLVWKLEIGSGGLVLGWEGRFGARLDVEEDELGWVVVGRWNSGADEFNWDVGKEVLRYKGGGC